MAIKIIGSTIIDDSRNIVNAGIATVTSVSIGNTQVISSARQLQNIASLDATTTATIEAAIAVGPNTMTDLQVTGVSTFTNGPVLIGGGTSTGTASQRLQVTGGAYVSGNLGIGITNPSQKLEINGRTVITTGTGPFYGLKVLDYTNTTGVYVGSVSGGNAWYIGDSYYYNSLLWRTDKTHASSINFINGTLEFYTNTGLTTGVDYTPSRRMILDSSGNLLVGSATSTGTASQLLQVTGGAYFSGSVGVGTTLPFTEGSTGTFTISGSQVSKLYLEDTGYEATGSGVGQLVYDNGNLSWSVGSRSGSTTTGSSELFRVLESGNLGIGTTNPLQSLHVLGNLLVAAGASTGQHITQKAYEVNSGTLSWEGSAGQLFSITNNLTSGSIFSVNDVSGIPSIDVDANGTIELAPFSGSVAIGTTVLTGTASQPLQVTGGAYVSTTLGVGATLPLTTLDVRGKTLLWNQPNVGYAVTKGDMDTYAVLKLRGHATDSTNMQFAHINNGNAMGVQVTNALNTANWDILLNPFGGNIGIGTTNPSSTLQVQGSGQFVVAAASSSSTSNSAIYANTPLQTVSAFFGQNTSVSGLTGDQYSTAIRFNGNNVVWGDLSYYPNQGGQGHFRFSLAANTVDTTPDAKLGVGDLYVASNVGIAITNPGARLHVVPAASSIAGIFSGTTSADMVRITQLGTGNALVVEDSANPDSTPFVVNASGSVGIGTTNPTSLLQVQGDIRITGISTFAGITTSTSSLFANNLSVSGITTSSRITLNGANSTTTGGGQIYLNGATGNRIDFAAVGGAAPAFTTRSAGTKIVLYPGVSASTVDYGFGIESGALWSSVESAASSFKWYAGTTNIATLFGTGELVIGSTTTTGTASQPLQVTGGAYVSGNLGIGITNPGSELQLYSTGGTGLRLTDSTGSLLTNPPNEGWYIGQRTRLAPINAAALEIYADSDSSIDKGMLLDYSGNLGIGTQSPQSKLQIRGSITFGEIGNHKIFSTGYESGFTTTTTDVQGWYYTGKMAPAGDFGPQALSVVSVSLPADRLFVVGNTNDRVSQYTLSVPGDITTIGSATTFFSTASQDTTPVGIDFNNNGTKMYIAGQTGVAPLTAGVGYVHQYTLTTPYSVAPSNVGYTTSYRILEESGLQGVRFGNNGSSMYVVGSTNDTVFQYNLTTPYDLTTGVSYGSSMFFGTLANIETLPTDLVFNESGSRLWVIGYNNDRICEFRLGTAWDITTATFFNDVYVGFNEITSTGLSICNGNAYITGTINDSIYQYNITDPSIQISSNGVFVVNGATGISSQTSIVLNNETRVKDNLYVKGLAHFDTNILTQGTLTVDGTSTLTGAVSISGNLTVSGGTITAGNVATSLLTGNTTTAIDFATAQTSGALTLGGTAQTGTMTINRSTVTHTLNIDAGVSLASTIKTINFGTGGAANSFTRINIGPSAGVGTVGINTGTLVGVGTLSPQANFDVCDLASTPSVSPVIFIQRPNSVAPASVGVTNAELRIKGHSANNKIYVEDQNANPLFIVEGDGSVGIGTTNPTALLQVGASSTQAFVVSQVGTAVSVGIGTINPSDKLTVSGKIQIQQDSGSNNRLVLRGQPASLYRWNIDNYGPENTFRIFREDESTAANGAVVVGINTANNVGIGLTNPTAKLQLIGGTATTAPLKIASGTNLTTPEAGAFEYDGTLLYHTQNDTTNGNKRALIPEIQFIRRTNQVAITTTLSPGTSIFGAASRPALLSGNFYEVEAVLFFTKTTIGTVTLQASLSTGTFTQVALQSYQNSQNAVNTSSAASPVIILTTTSLANANDYNIIVKGLVQPSANARLDLLAYNSAGSVGFNTNSHIKVTCVGSASSIGNFA